MVLIIKAKLFCYFFYFQVGAIKCVGNATGKEKSDNSFDLLPQGLITFINNLDTFLLTMAMTALGAETSIDKFKKAGAKPFILASLLYLWLIAGGYFQVKFLAPVLM